MAVLIHLENILVLSDDEGPFGSPYVDSARTAVTEETTNALHVFFLRPSMDSAEALELTTAAAKCLQKLVVAMFALMFYMKINLQLR